MSESDNPYKTVKICAEFIESLNKLKTSVLTLSGLNFFNKAYTEEMFSVEVRTIDDIVVLFNNIKNAIASIGKIVHHQNTTEDVLDLVVDQETMSKLNAYNIYVTTINDFIVKFSRVLKMVGSDCNLMVIKNDIHEKIVNGTLVLNKIDMSRYTLDEDATLLK